MHMTKNEKSEEKTNSEEQADNHNEWYIDTFKLCTNGMLDTDLVTKIELPKFELKASGNKKQQIVQDHSGLLITFVGDPLICQQLFLASKKGFSEFKIKFLDGRKTMSTWNFIGAYVKAVDLGSLSAIPRQGLREVECEISYQSIDIDGVTL